MSARVAYASKFPPLAHGVATYADLFADVLEPLGDVVRISLADGRGSTQSLRSVVRGFARGWRGFPGRQVVVVELSGRALAELFYLVGVTLRRRSTFTVATCHDPPSVVGASLLFDLLDRRGLRRVGMALSSGLGARLERRTLQRCDVVCALTDAGAEALSSILRRHVDALGHVTCAAPVVDKQRTVFLPGWVSDEAAIGEIAAVVAAAGKGWRLIVGAADAEHLKAELSAMAPEVRSVVTNQGLVPHETLMATYAGARVVVRMTGGKMGANSLAASGPLAWAAAHGCLIVTDDRRPVVDELESIELLERSGDVVADLRRVLSSGLPGDSYAAQQTARTERYFGVETTRARFGAIMDAARGSDGSVSGRGVVK